MDTENFKDFAKAMIDYIADYLDNIRDRPVVPNVQPGYLRPLLPKQAPEQAEPWTAVMADIERVVMTGMTHWQTPRFHAYFPAAQSYPALVADMLSGAIACIGFTWIASPACTEMEVVMLDWLGQMLGLPEEFLARSGGEGGGVIQGTASESTLVALLGAKARILHHMKERNPDLKEADILSKLVGYASNLAHSSVERAGLLGGVKMRAVKSDSKRQLRGNDLRDTIEEDIRQGLIPFFVVATLGTTSSCTFDNLDEIGDVCKDVGIWLHVDAAYAGSVFVCPEYRYLMKGIEKADSFDFNPHKWLLVNFDCSAMWLKQPRWIVDAFNVDPLYLQHDNQGSATDYRHWQIPLGRRFRALKLWFVLRLYGVENLQKHIRKQIALAHLFENLCLKDQRFELAEEVTMALVCFKLKGGNELNKELLRCINSRGKIHLIPSEIDGVYFLRLAICSRMTEESDIHFSWEEIRTSADETLKTYNQGSLMTQEI
ncbi:pyridoxal-dependent decarboxylase conserved domain-containing protein [Phthorimaea operculella]|nr:pyridoxal-dependent decarboxylase conserved domain-containing protein [Phthorimaea operculella]